MRCALRPLSPATPPLIPTHAFIASSSHGRGRARLHAVTCWLCRSYPKGHPCLCHLAPHICLGRVCSRTHCRDLAHELTHRPGALLVFLSLALASRAPRHHQNTPFALTGAGVLGGIHSKHLHPRHLHPRTLFKRPHRAARQASDNGALAARTERLRPSPRRVVRGAPQQRASHVAGRADGGKE